MGRVGGARRVAPAVMVVMALLWAVACGDGEGGSGATTSVAPEDTVWVPSDDVEGTTLRSVGAFGTPPSEAVPDDEVMQAEAALPDAIAVSQVDGATLVASILPAASRWIGGASEDGQPIAATRWLVPQPGHRHLVDLPDGRILVVGSRELDGDRLAELAGSVSVLGNAISLPGTPVGSIDLTQLAGVESRWDVPEASESLSGVMPVWIITLEDRDQLAALLAAADPSADAAARSALETVPSSPLGTTGGPRQVDVLGRRAVLTALNGYSRMVAVPTDPPVVVIGNDGARYPTLSDDVLLAVARSLRREPRLELGDRLAGLRVTPLAPAAEPLEESTTTVPPTTG